MTRISDELINARLRVLLAGCREPVLREAMTYSVFAGGKRLRPRLLLAACEAVCGDFDAVALDFACAAEMIHTYSLIHDDLPAMDDDDFRRGQPTSHKRFGEATAILAGDALLHGAFEIMTDACLSAKKSKQTLRAMRTLAQATGFNGMVAGQAADMVWEHKKIDGDTLLAIHRRKTGALIKACLVAGARLGGGSGAYLKDMARVGSRLGCAFQIMDDILDVTASDAVLGKPAHSDEKNQKNTYVSVFGLAQARKDYQIVSADVLARLSRLPQKTNSLFLLAERITNRVC